MNSPNAKQELTILEGKCDAPLVDSPYTACSCRSSCLLACPPRHELKRAACILANAAKSEQPSARRHRQRADYNGHGSYRDNFRPGSARLLTKRPHGTRPICVMKDRPDLLARLRVAGRCCTERCRRLRPTRVCLVTRRGRLLVGRDPGDVAVERQCPVDGRRVVPGGQRARVNTPQAVVAPHARRQPL